MPASLAKSAAHPPPARAPSPQKRKTRPEDHALGRAQARTPPLPPAGVVAHDADFCLVAPAAAAAARAACAALLRLIAIPAVHRPIATRLKGHRRLLPATGADYRRSSWLRSLIAAPATASAHLALLRLTTALAAFGCGVPALLKKCLVFALVNVNSCPQSLQMSCRSPAMGSSFPLLRHNYKVLRPA
jgi:hypothetical protein